MKNTKNKRCLTKKNKKKCCPHMDLDSKGRYAATGNSHKLKYKGNNYIFWTCCKQCGYTMLDLQKSNPKKFEKLYIKGLDKDNNLLLKHKDTQKVVQIAKINKKDGYSGGRNPVLRKCVGMPKDCEYHLKCRNKNGKWEYMKRSKKYLPEHCKNKSKSKKSNKKGGKSYLKYHSKSMKCVSVNGVEICKKQEYKFPNKKSKKISKKYSKKIK